jgi:hypothetical protein
MSAPAFTDRRRSVLVLLALGLAASAASLFIPQAPGILGDIGRLMFGLAAAAAFIAAVVHAVQLSAEPAPAPLPAKDSVPPA